MIQRMMSTPALETHWRCCRFDALSVYELQYIYMVRQQVFCVEQRCAYLDVDGRDEAAWHLAAWSDEQRMPLAYARVIAPGVKYSEPAIGRVLTFGVGRGVGLGRMLVQRAIAKALAEYPGLGIRLSAQSHLEGFYRSEGFLPVGEGYLEDGIPHIEMCQPG
jgi:ElaA protein